MFKISVDRNKETILLRNTTIPSNHVWCGDVAFNGKLKKKTNGLRKRKTVKKIF